MESPKRKRGKVDDDNDNDNDDDEVVGPMPGDFSEETVASKKIKCK